MSTAERRSYQQICDPGGGRILVVACDQRNSMRAAMTSSKEEAAQISDTDLGEVKADLVRYLANRAPCVLLDPICALPGVVDEQVLARDVALMVGLDASGWDPDQKTGLRRSRLVSGMSPRRVRQLGGNAAKMLVHVRPDREDESGYAARLISQITSEYSSEDLLMVLELIVYRLDGESPDTYEASRAILIKDAACLAVECGAKVLKLQYPGSAESCAAITAALGAVPWALLSEGVSHDTYLGQLELALANGAAGAIAGRSLWRDCIPRDASTRRQKLLQVAAPRLDDLRVLVRAAGTPAPHEPGSGR